MSSETSSTAQGPANRARVVTGLSGLVALIAGILVLIWPGHFVKGVIWVFALYAIIAGIVYIGNGVFSRPLGGWKRLGHIIVGVLYIIAGVIAVANTTRTAVWAALFVAIFVGIMWIVEGAVTLSNLGASRSRGWSLFFGVLSIIAGIILLVSPAGGALFLAVFAWLYVGISLIVLGAVQIMRAFRLAAVKA